MEKSAVKAGHLYRTQRGTIHRVVAVSGQKVTFYSEKQRASFIETGDEIEGSLGMFATQHEPVAS